MKESADLLREMLRNISFCYGFMPAESLRSMFYSDYESFTLLFISYCLYLYSNC